MTEPNDLVLTFVKKKSKVIAFDLVFVQEVQVTGYQSPIITNCNEGHL